MAWQFCFEIYWPLSRTLIVCYLCIVSGWFESVVICSFYFCCLCFQIRKQQRHQQHDMTTRANMSEKVMKIFVLRPAEASRRGFITNDNWCKHSVDILCGQPIKLIQVASNSKLRENQWNDLLFFEIVPSHCFGASEASKVDYFQNENFGPKILIPC